jgi:hypothetical protein
LGPAAGFLRAFGLLARSLRFMFTFTAQVLLSFTRARSEPTAKVDGTAAVYHSARGAADE